MSIPTRWLREPFVHFLLLGVLLSGMYQTVVSSPANTGTPEPIILIADSHIGQMGARFEAVRARPPAEQGIESLVTVRVHEEVLVRDAIALYGQPPQFAVDQVCLGAGESGGDAALLVAELRRAYLAEATTAQVEARTESRSAMRETYGSAS